MREVKRQLRKELIQRRRDMDIAVKSSQDESIFTQLLPLLKGVDRVFTYCSTEIEVDTWRLIDYCFSNGIAVATPVSGDSELFFYEIKSREDLKEGRFGILEPVNRSESAVSTENSLCIVPCLTADGDGYRLGYGRGYYDRFLAEFKGRSVILCYSDFKGAVPTEPHDRKADITIFDKTTNPDRED